MKRMQVKFDGLSGALQLPDNDPIGYVIFAHCFTCTKNIMSAQRIANCLTAFDYAVLRFDFSGIGASEGDFANTNFSSDTDDIVRAAMYLEENYEAPMMLVGHSLGGAAVLAATKYIPSTKAVVTIGAPSHPSHLTHLFSDELTNIKSLGKKEVQLAGRPFTITQQFIDDLYEQELDIKKLNAGLLVMHSPTDDTVDISNAEAIFKQAKHPKSFVSLDGIDHLVTEEQAAYDIGYTIYGWSRKYRLGR